jgi:hypothetical protein
MSRHPVEARLVNSVLQAIIAIVYTKAGQRLIYGYDLAIKG